MSADIEYLKAFDRRKADGEINPEHRAKADVVTQRSIARKKKKAQEEADAKASGPAVKAAPQKATDVASHGGGEGVAGGALSGAATGMAIGGPWGAAAGAALGGLGAAKKEKKAQYAAKKAGMSNALGTYLQLIDKGMV